MKRIIGITGGIGSGKSQVLNILKKDFGARIIQADEVAHCLMEPGMEGYVKIVEALGTGFLAPNGNINQEKLGKLIFHNPEVREIVNRIIHPMVWKEIEVMARKAPEELVIVESALMGQKQREQYHELWYVYTDEEERIRRLMRDRGYSREKCLSIMASQKKESEFRAICSQVIDNNGSVEEIRREIEKILICQDGRKRTQI